MDTHEDCNQHGPDFSDDAQRPVEALVMRKVQLSDVYISGSGEVMRREIGNTPNGNDMNGSWVFRDAAGKMVDCDKYRNDIAERNNLILQTA